MPTPTETPTELGQEQTVRNTPRPNGMTDEQVKELLDAIGRRKNDPGYLQRWEEGVAEYRRQVQEEWERESAENEPK